MPTYEEGTADPNPAFDQFTANKFNYPYTLRENLSSRRVDHGWRAIYLENEYLKCTIVPDIGGHLYTCIDKISGQSMCYDNSSIKTAAVGYRGAWAGFGIEFNFPVSHNWASMSPVDFAFRQNPDGRDAVFVGNVDRVYGMEWHVELLLRPDRRFWKSTSASATEAMSGTGSIGGTMLLSEFRMIRKWRRSSTLHEQSTWWERRMPRAGERRRQRRSFRLHQRLPRPTRCCGPG